MGVIDLDKRVRKLEQDGAGGAVVDQLEAAVTAIENELTVTVTDVTDDITADPEIIMEGVTCDLAVLEKYGAIEHFHAEFTATESNTGVNGVVYTVPEELRPRYNSSAVSAYNEVAAQSVFFNGGIYVTYQFPDAGTVYADLYWIVNPEPTPGE